MKIAVLGMGVVGETIATKLIENGHDIMIGSRISANKKAMALTKNISNAHYGTFADAAGFAEDIIFNCINGKATLVGLLAAGKENMTGKVLIDLANPLDFSNGMPPTLFVCNNDSLGEQVQRKFPDTYVVKSLNTMNCTIMLNPTNIMGNHTVFMSGDNLIAKNKVAQLLMTFDWKKENIIDLGDITTARGAEMMLLMWINLYGVFDSPNFCFNIQN